ncbi:MULTISPECIES: FRG domain-containing protein [Streptacidiphilus]|uniref:FRG domain-containing protein n=1 Tax=Streptacidiphilus cavernicola TaxID=3342716 RepID=A0ABV6UZX7_9ACTN|nr:FRG domain-containing protein [Streptacidiphilus jeojiense]
MANDSHPATGNNRGSSPDGDAVSNNLAGEFFAEREINSKIGLDGTFQSLWEWLKAGARDPLDGGSLALPSPPVESVFYRGQSNADHGLSSSLFRILQNSVTRVTEHRMARTEADILRVMRSQGLGRLMTDGQLLGLMQHHGIPTRLIDVSKAPFEALFFAVDQNHDLDGRLFVIQLHRKSSDAADIFYLDAQRCLEWADAARGEQYAKSSWTGRVAVADPKDLDPRMRAQQGCFLVGGLIASYSRRQMQFNGKTLEPLDLAKITNLSIRFPLRNAAGKAWSATAWTIRIPASWKRPLGALLKKEDHPITVDTMYPPLIEVKRLAISKAEELSRTTWQVKNNRRK